MNPSVGKVEAFGLLAGDVWAPEHPSYLYNTLFNMAGSHPYSFVDDGVVEPEAATEDVDDGVDWSHLIPIIDDLLVEDYSDGDEASVAEEPADKDDGSTVDGDAVLPELPKPDDAAAAADENPDEPADDGNATREETPGTTFCFTTAAVLVPAVVSRSEDFAPVPATVGARSTSSSSTRRRRKQRKKAPSLSLASNGESSSTTKIDTAREDGCKGLAGDLGGTTAEAAVAG